MEPQENIKVVTIGDGSTGKTCILIRYTKKTYDEEYIPTIYESYSAPIQFAKKLVNLELVDTAGQDEYGNLRNLAYPNTDVFLITFSVVEPSTYHNALQKWYPELNQKNPDAIKIFVGNKIDIRDEEAKKHKAGDKNAPIDYIQAQQEISKLGCKYIECSAKTNVNIKDVFDLAIKTSLQKKDKLNQPKEGSKKSEKEKGKKKKGICNIF
ncbi:P-loop containing nucleoside triphosphate hydrolase [Pseudocohnilembus persalinus]|uniref:p-loop containing nucleoside triphosphate hydrolase n=1 Tax=Pseudocohnilembus persalinus TaxID=266149 RepID=A0A0V0R1D0_PSEPJ|nr:P-loop containing nucleoside triphosphate hydrolase [Pseudocohnilembus persalinus]|eukprot:KRX07960.1 P-loop containing nucleoside triphosphate hydrolase [Pseudocohnilembus persalinus]